MLEQIRKLYGYTQSELAGKIGISQNFFTQIESGASKSAPSIAKLSDVLRVKKSLLLSQGEYLEYPFLSDFYVFNLIEHSIVWYYKFIADLICSKSAFIDVIFFLSLPNVPRSPTMPWIMPRRYILMRDDRDTIFLFKRLLKTRKSRVAGKNMEHKFIEPFTMLDSFRRILHSLRETKVHEMTIIAPDDLYEKIDSGEVTRGNVLPFFPDADYFYKQYEVHKTIKGR